MNNLSAFKSFLISNKNLSQNTVNSYLSDVKKFLNFANVGIVSGCEKNLCKQFDYYLIDIEEKNLPASTQNRILISLRIYFDYLSELKILSINPAKDIKSKKINHTNITVLERNEIVKLLSIADETLKGRRDKTILELLYATGIKVSELINVKTSNINFKLGLLNISNEYFSRTLPISNDVLSILNDYCNDVRPMIAKENTDYLFTNMHGELLSRQGVWKLIKYYSNLSGIKKEIDINTIRHTFAVHTLENGAEIEYLNRLLGNRNINSTKQYIRYIHNKYSI